jgi:hypothetical protein
MAGAIDLQYSVLQASTADKVQQAHQQHPDMQQRYFSLQMIEDRKLQKEKVSRQDDTEKALVRDGGHKNSPERQAAKRDREEKGQMSEEEESGQGGLIDIKI